MKERNLKLFVLCLLGLLISAAGVAEGDWDPGDGHKMHWPQLPDPFGWDVTFDSVDGGLLELADDWQCSETGPVSDIHFWVSWKGDQVGMIDWITVAIYSDNPMGSLGYSEPNQPLWQMTLSPGDWTERYYGSGAQGWFDPFEGSWIDQDHAKFRQINITSFDDEFIQEEGEIYWLKIVISATNGLVGWKTTQDHWNDDAVFRDMIDMFWKELLDPRTFESLDLAFVITGKQPEVVKWVQLPDLADTGLDVDASVEGMWPEQILADDFNCVVTGPITDIHVWGSWYHDLLPFGYDPYGVSFTLSIHEDIPKDQSSTGYSMPGELLWLWTFDPGDFDASLYASNLREGWFVPCLLPPYHETFADSNCWQYDFYIDPCNAFWQRGTLNDPCVYWLDVQAQPWDTYPEVRFGWKTSLDHWNDDAVWAQGLEPWFGPWFELRYPPTHELADLSMDLAFAITTQDQPAEELDFGDAPDPTYPTLLVNDGARHVITAAGPWLDDGSGTDAPDSEPDGQPDATATGDDLDADGDDEDGVTIAPSPLVPGGMAFISFTVAGGPGCVDGWIDWNQNGSFDAVEAIPSTCYAAVGPYVIVTPVPLAAVPGTTFARIRISTAGGLAPTGLASDGEVEDLMVEVEQQVPEPKPPTPHLKWSQPPIEIDPNIWPPVYCGWDEPSWTSDPTQAFDFYTAADDFRCLGTMPVTSVHWWGSHVGWQDVDPPVEPPPDIPITGWLIRFYTNVPAIAGADPNYSHPQVLLWEVMVDPDRVQREWVGEDYFPDPAIIPDTCFQYYVDLDPTEWFWQDHFRERTTDDVYWISIQAVYGTVGADPVYPWGWKTRPCHWMDDAVRYQCRIVGPTIVCRMWPIKDPVWGESFDLAFELDTDPNYIKWEQPFTGIRHWPHYEDEESMAFEDDTGMVDITRLVADDWHCDANTPITAAVWWGSYIGYRYEACKGPPTLMPAKPDYFLLNIWADVPAGADPPYLYSHPGKLIWSYRADNYDEVCVGYDKHPEDQTGPPKEPVFRYSVKLPCENWFFQDTNDGIYWLSVVAVYKAGNDPMFQWGWTNHEHVFNDDAVAGTFDAASGWFWDELLDQTGKSEDMSFVLFTDPDPKLGTCWDICQCPCQPQGDCTCDGRTNFADLFCLKSHFGKCAPWVAPECCADFTQNGCVNFGDLFALKANFGLICPLPSTGNQKCP